MNFTFFRLPFNLRVNRPKIFGRREAMEEWVAVAFWLFPIWIVRDWKHEDLWMINHWAINRRREAGTMFMQIMASLSGFFVGLLIHSTVTNHAVWLEKNWYLDQYWQVAIMMVLPFFCTFFATWKGIEQQLERLHPTQKRVWSCNSVRF